MVCDEQNNIDEDMNYYNSYSAIKRHKKYEKTSLTAKSKETYMSIKTKFLNIIKQVNETLEYHESQVKSVVSL